MSLLALPDQRVCVSAENSLFRRLASFPAVIGAALVLLTVITVRHRFSDLDLWWHLKIGEQIWSTHSIPRFDTLSYTTHHHPRATPEWLVEWLLFASYHLAGYSGLMLWMCIVSSGIVLISYVLALLYSGNAKTALLPAMLVWFFSTSVFAVRPQLMGFLLLSLELLFLELARRGYLVACYLLPVLFVLWVNSHSSFALGLGVLLLTGLCATFETDVGLLSTLPWRRADRKHLWFATCASFTAVAINPVGTSLINYPFDTLLHQQAVLRNVQEWQPLSLQDGRGMGLFLVLVLVAVVVLVQKQKVYTQELGLLIVGTWLACSHQRLAVVFGLFLAPLVSRLISRFWDSYDPSRDIPKANALLIGAALLGMVGAFPGRSNLLAQVEAANPVGAIRFIRTRHLQGNMFNSFDYGGYLIWALPEHPVFIDGRADVYDWTGVMSEVAAWSSLSTAPNTLLDKYAVSFCILERDSPPARILSLLPNWNKIYDDPKTVIYIRSKWVGASEDPIRRTD